MLFFASFPTPRPLQAEIHQLPAPPLSKLLTTQPASKRLSTSSTTTSLLSTLGLQKSAPAPPPQPAPRAIPRLSKCTHQRVTRYYTAASTSTPAQLKLRADADDEYCQRCRRQHWFRWVYVCDMCAARACHNCRPKWAERAWGSFAGLAGVMEEGARGVEAAAGVKGGEKEKEEKKLKRRSKRWSGGAWLRELKEGT